MGKKAATLLLSLAYFTAASDSLARQEAAVQQVAPIDKFSEDQIAQMKLKFLSHPSLKDNQQEVEQMLNTVLADPSAHRELGFFSNFMAAIQQVSSVFFEQVVEAVALIAEGDFDAGIEALFKTPEVDGDDNDDGDHDDTDDGLDDGHFGEDEAFADFSFVFGTG